MDLKAHLLWQALASASVPLVYKASDKERVAAEARQREVTGKILAAHKFGCMFEGLLDDEVLRQTAAQLWRAGVLRAPFELCYFEIDAAKGSYREAVVLEASDDWRHYEAAYFVLHRREGHWIDPGITFRIDYRLTPPEACEIPDFEQFSAADFSFFREASEFGLCHMIDVCCVMSTKHAKLEHRPAPDRLNKKRERTGKPPIFDYRVLTLDLTTAEGAEGSGTHASPRLHWRRGHVRTLASGLKVPVQPCLVGLAERGVISKDYRVAAPAKKRAPEGEQ